MLIVARVLSCVTVCLIAPADEALPPSSAVVLNGFRDWRIANAEDNGLRVEALNALARVNTVAVDILRQVGVGPVLLRVGEGVAVVLFRGSLDPVGSCTRTMHPRAARVAKRYRLDRHSLIIERGLLGRCARASRTPASSVQ